MTPPRVILKAKDIAAILGQVLDGQNEVLVRYDAADKRATALESQNAALERRIALTEEKLAILLQAIAERRKMFQSIAKQSFIGLLKILGMALLLTLLGVSFHDALLKAAH